MEGSAAGPSFLGTFALVFIAILVLFAIDTFLAKTEEAEMHAEAIRLFHQGQRLTKQGRSAEAVELFRAAAAIARGEKSYQLALARAWLAAGKPAEAEPVLSELLRRDSTDGGANLTMAQLLVREGRIAEATSYYHRAIYGRWEENEAGHRVQARFELIDLLAKQGAQQELLAELLPLQEEAPGDIEGRKRIAHLFLAAGSPARAVQAYREVLRQKRQDPEAYAGLGEAEFARGNFAAAEGAFLAASRLKPDDAGIRGRLELCSEVLALDPTRRGLSWDERYRRSRKLVEMALEAANRCASAPGLADKARRALRVGIRGSETNRAIDANLDLAEELWQARKKECKQKATPAEEPLALVLGRVAQ